MTIYGKTEIMEELARLANQMSPENLMCDGEISRTQAIKKLRKLRAEWRRYEKMLGYKVTEYDLLV